MIFPFRSNEYIQFCLWMIGVMAYNGSDRVFRRFLRFLNAPETSATSRPQSGVKPACSYWVHSGELYVCFNGMSNPRQAQAMVTACSTADDNANTHGVSQFQIDTARALMNDMLLGNCSQYTKIHVIAHSYGAFIAMGFLKIMDFNGLFSRCDLTTFGAPKTIRHAKRTVWELLPTNRIMREDDVVPNLLPYTRDNLTAMSLSVIPNIAQWNTWSHHQLGIMIMNDGRREDAEVTPTLTGAMGLNVWLWLTEVMRDASPTHGWSAYTRDWHDATFELHFVQNALNPIHPPRGSAPEIPSVIEGEQALAVEQRRLDKQQDLASRGPVKFPLKGPFVVVKELGKYFVYVDDEAVCSFTTSSKANRLARKGNSMIRALLKANEVAAIDMGDAITRLIVAIVDPSGPYKPRPRSV